MYTLQFKTKDILGACRFKNFACHKDLKKEENILFNLQQKTNFMESITNQYLLELRIMIMSLVFLFVSNEMAEETSDSIV